MPSEVNHLVRVFACRKGVTRRKSAGSQEAGLALHSRSIVKFVSNRVLALIATRWRTRLGRKSRSVRFECISNDFDVELVMPHVKAVINDGFASILSTLLND